MSLLANKVARLLALLGLIAGLLTPAVPGFAAMAPAQPSAVHAAMGCGDSHHQAPARHLPGSIDCCVANTCAMNLALPTHPSGVALSALPETTAYDLRPLQQPAGINTAPIPHPPKPAA